MEGSKERADRWKSQRCIRLWTSAPFPETPTKIFD